jgi:hypothetical protein
LTVHLRGVHETNRLNKRLAVFQVFKRDMAVQKKTIGREKSETTDEQIEKAWSLRQKVPDVCNTYNSKAGTTERFSFCSWLPFSVSSFGPKYFINNFSVCVLRTEPYVST